jgi:hypothetical protein
MMTIYIYIYDIYVCIYIIIRIDLGHTRLRHGELSSENSSDDEDLILEESDDDDIYFSAGEGEDDR